MATPTREEVDNALAILSKVDYDFYEDKDDMARMQTLQKLRAVERRLEKPRQTMTRMVWLEPVASVIVKIAQDVKLFSSLPQEGQGLSVDELAQATGIAPDLLMRFLPILNAIDMIEVTDAGRYLGNHRSKAFTDPNIFGGMEQLTTQNWAILSKLPEFLQKNGYRSPEDPTNGPFQYALNTTDGFFDWLAKRPALNEGFNNLMEGKNFIGNSWVQLFPADTLANDLPESTDTPLVVDIGGGTGSDMNHLRGVLPPQAFRVEVQDTEGVVAHGKQLPQNNGINFRAHNFFDPQPVIGAKAYFLHSILHDWPDHLALKILRNVHAAMKPGYSKLLLCEGVVEPGHSRSQFICSIDIMMMGLLCAKERTEIEWKELLQRAGFKVEKLWNATVGWGETVIEATPV